MIGPKPITLIAFLPSAGFGKPRATLHKFLETREVHLTDANRKKITGGEAWEHIFVCTETGEERRWGLSKRNPTPSWEKAGN